LSRSLSLQSMYGGMAQVPFHWNWIWVEVCNGAGPGFLVVIAVCDMQFKDTKVQWLMWTKLNETMLKHKFPKLNFKGFMANSAQANYNAVKIVYGLREPFY
jgi:hypothetical protein